MNELPEDIELLNPENLKVVQDCIEIGKDDGDVATIHVDRLQALLDGYKSSLAANREQKAEIERLTHRLIRANLAFVLSDAVLPTDFETELPPTKRLHTYISKLEAELASLRASVGEKPEDAFERGFDEGVGSALHKIGESVHLHPMTKLETFILECPAYVAPPTLPAEEK